MAVDLLNHLRIAMTNPLGNRKEVDPGHDALGDEVMSQGVAVHLG